MGKQHRAPTSEQDKNVIPVLFTLNVPENGEIVTKLNHAIIVENSEILDIVQVTVKLFEAMGAKMGMFHLSPTKLLFCFENDLEKENALNEDSIFWLLFDEIRRWSEGEYFGDRVVWLECFGLHPKCWSLDNIKKLGQKWGPVLRIDHNKDGFDSLTYARFLVRIKAQNKVDA
ncbi:unnamed protein product [Amaranthus hypochondriacus]